MSYLPIVLGIILLPIVWVSIVRLIWEERVVPDEVHFAATEDGYEVALYRYRPKVKGSRREPVIICHGLGANHHEFLPKPFNSLARYLVEEGFDVFCLDLRGHGLSSKPDGHRGRKLEHWTFDDYVEYDLPAAIKYVRRETGSKKVNWVGHSMGGMAIYAYLQHHEDGGGLRCATAIASPGSFANAKQYAIPAMLGNIFLRGNRFYSREFVRFIAPFAYLIPYEHFELNRKGVPWIAVNCVSNTSTGVMRQFQDWASNKRFCNKDGSFMYSDNFHKIKTPLLTMIARGDFIVHPGDVKHVADRVVGPQHKHVFYSKKLGSLGNYDHNSIVMGEHVREEVFPVVADWLKAHPAE